MTDILLRWNESLSVGDIETDGADLASEDGLKTAILLSLFTDRRAEADDLPDGEVDRRGWWGDSLAEDGFRLGSLLWTLRREKQTTEVLRKAERHSRDALAWMVEDGVLRKAEADAAWRPPQLMCLDVRVTRPDGTILEYQFLDALQAG